MKSKILLLLAAILLGSLSPLAAKGDKKADREKWFAEIQQYKKEYIIKALQMTDDQKAKFVPIYDAYERDMRKVQNEARQLAKTVKKKGASATDADYRAAAEKMYQLKTREGQIEAAFYQKIKAFLTPRQLYELKVAEDRFVREMMRHHRDKKK